jgi:hypothetical protein
LNLVTCNFCGKNLGIPQGHGSYPMYDSDDLTVEKYFTDEKKFEALCSGLVENQTKNTLIFK